MKVKHPLLLIVLDGWGHSEDKTHNAIAQANTPCWDRLWQHYPHALLHGSGAAVGLPVGQMGNSEVGHLHIGAGRRLPQDLSRIDESIEQGHFENNSVINSMLDDVIEHDRALHIMGLFSAGGVHAHERHWVALLQSLAKKNCERVYLHLFLDGRDSAPCAAEHDIAKLQEQLQQLRCGHIASIVGRYYAMDRDQRWDRTQQAYDLLTQRGQHEATDALSALRAAYNRDETDEFVTATQIEGGATLQAGDAIMFMNFRADRARQLCRALTDEDFSGFTRHVTPAISRLVTMTQYADDLNATCAFPPIHLQQTIGQLVAEAGGQQLRIAETEKYAHVTFFFNGGVEQPFSGEDRLLIPSPQVATYDHQPAMSAEALTDQLIQAMQRQHYDMIICNYANADMVGHTGDFAATITAIETLDSCLQRVLACCEQQGVECMITADHGNAEAMYDPDRKQILTAHSSNPVPFVYCGRKPTQMLQTGTLCDIAPTMCVALGLPIPTEMTGQALLSLTT